MSVDQATLATFLLSIGTRPPLPTPHDLSRRDQPLTRPQEQQTRLLTKYHHVWYAIKDDVSNREIAHFPLVEYPLDLHLDRSRSFRGAKASRNIENHIALLHRAKKQGDIDFQDRCPTGLASWPSSVGFPIAPVSRSTPER